MRLHSSLLALLGLAVVLPASAQHRADEEVFDDFQYRSLDLCHYWTSHLRACSPPSRADASLFGSNTWAVEGPDGSVEERPVGPAWYRYGWTNNGLADGATVALRSLDGGDDQGFSVGVRALPNGELPVNYPSVVSGLTRRTGTWAARVRLADLKLPGATGADLVQAFWGFSPDGVRYEHGFDARSRPPLCSASSPTGPACYDPSRAASRLYGTEIDHEWNNFFDDHLVRARGGAFDATGVRLEAPDTTLYHIGQKVPITDQRAFPAKGGWAVLVMRLSGVHARFDLYAEASGREASSGWHRLRYPTTRPIAAQFSQHFSCADGGPCDVRPGFSLEMPVDWFLYSSDPSAPTAALRDRVTSLRERGYARYYRGGDAGALTADVGNLFDGGEALGSQTPPVLPGTVLHGSVLRPAQYRSLEPDVWAVDVYNRTSRRARSTDYEVAWRWSAPGRPGREPFRVGGFTGRPPRSMREHPVCAQVRIRDLGSIRDSEAMTSSCAVDAFGCEGRTAPVFGPGRPYRAGDPEVEWTSSVVCELD